MESVKVLSNPVLQECLTRLRDERTGRREFRGYLRKAGLYMAYELANYLPKREVRVKTPLGYAEGVEIESEEIVVVAVLRAAVPMADGIVETLGNVRLGLVSASRVENEHADKVGYRMDVEIKYSRVPEEGSYLVVVDPMLATGSTIAKVLEEINSKKYKEVYILSVISTETGIKRVLEKEPRARILTLAIDPVLNSRAYIVPGLGDAGDRAFG